MIELQVSSLIGFVALLLTTLGGVFYQVILLRDTRTKLDHYCRKVDQLEGLIGAESKGRTLAQESLARVSAKTQSAYVLDTTCQEREKALVELVDSRFEHIEFRLNQLVVMIEKLAGGPAPTWPTEQPSKR